MVNLMEKQLKILLLEDDKHDIFLFKNELTANGINHELLVTQSKKELIALLNSNEFDVVVSDFTVPEFNGLEALSIVKEKVPETPFIILTGSVNEETAVACIKAGADDYILKHHLKRIVPTMNVVLDKYKQLKAKAQNDQKLNSLISNVPDIITIYDLDYKLTFINKAEDGIDEKILSDLTIFDITDPKYHSVIKDAFDYVVEKRKTGYYETSFLTNGIEHFYSNRVAPIMDGNKIINYIVISTDETHLRNAILSSTKSSKQFQMLFNGMTEGVALHEIVYDDKGNPIDYVITNVNPKYETILQIKKENVLHKKGSEVYKSEEAPFLKLFAEVAETGNPQYIEVYFQPLDKHLAISISSSERGKFATIFSEITERIKTQKELAESRRVLFTLMSNLPGMAYKCKNDRDWTMEFISEGCYSLTGYHPEDFLKNRKLSYNDIIFPEDKDRVWSTIQDAIEKKENFQLTYRIVHADSSVKWVWEQGIGIYDAENNLVALEGFISDVSDKIKAENELIESERKYRDLTNVISDFVYSASRDDDGIYKVEWIGGAFEKITGYSPDSIINKTEWTSFILPEDVNEFKETLNLITPCQSKIIESRIKTKTGSIRWIRQTIICECLIDSRCCGRFFAAAEDITEKKELMNELKHALDKAEESSKLKSTLLANLSHEFRTPMTGILGLSEIIKEIEHSPLINDYLDGIIKSSTRLLDTLNGVLELADLESNASDNNSEVILINSILEEVYESYTVKANAKNLEYRLTMPEKAYFLHSSYVELIKLFSKLVDNAIKFTEKGLIEIKLSNFNHKNSEYVLVEVIDTGIGIQPELKDFIFQDFRQASEGLNRNYEGTGLGLSIAQKIVNRWKGEITVESVLGEGSTFKVALPTHHEVVMSESFITERMGKNETATETNAKQLSNPSILCVEDNYINAQVITKYLNKEYDVDHAKDAVTCLEKIQEKHYDIILMDINLGRGMDGVQLSKEIKKYPNYKHIPIVAITGYAMRGDEEKFKSEGIEYYIAKPFTKKDVLNLLKKIFFMN